MELDIQPGDKLIIDGERWEVESAPTFYNYGRDTVAECDGADFLIYEDREDAEHDAAGYWRDMARFDPCEFTAIIGEERLLQWALGQSDDFGIRSAEEFFERNGEVPEETLAGYDGNEWDCVWCWPVDADGNRVERTYEDDEVWEEKQFLAYRTN